MSVLIRRAGRRDLEPIQKLWLSLRELQAKADARLVPSKDGPEWALKHRDVILADPRSGLFVAEDKGKLVGYLHAQVESRDPVYEPEKTGRIVDLIVSEARRSQGIGRRLLEYCEEWFDSQGLSEYRIEVPVQQVDTGRFLEARGAQPLLQIYRAELKS